MSRTLKSIRFDEASIKKIENLAKSENRSFNNMVHTIILRYFESVYKEKLNL